MQFSVISNSLLLPGSITSLQGTQLIYSKPHQQDGYDIIVKILVGITLLQEIQSEYSKSHQQGGHDIIVKILGDGITPLLGIQSAYSKPHQQGGHVIIIKIFRVFFTPLVEVNGTTIVATDQRSGSCRRNLWYRSNMDASSSWAELGAGIYAQAWPIGRFSQSQSKE